MLDLHEFFGCADHGCADSLDRIYGLDNGPNPRIEDVTKIPRHQEIHAMAGCHCKVIGIASGFLWDLYSIEIKVRKSANLVSNF
jgi:hypothetical protein